MLQILGQRRPEQEAAQARSERDERTPRNGPRGRVRRGGWPEMRPRGTLREVGDGDLHPREDALEHLGLPGGVRPELGGYRRMRTVVSAKAS